MPFSDKNKQKIRIFNTVYAAMGAIILTLINIYAHSMGYTKISDLQLTGWLLIFWCVNSFILFIIFSGANKSFKDPSLSMPQMLWAVFSCLVGISFQTEFKTAMYLLMMLTMIFGIFKINQRGYVLFCIFMLVGLVSVETYNTIYTQRDMRIENAIITILIFSYCAITLARFCGTQVKLRTRLKDKNNQLSEAIHTKNQFLANMSHEIRTPMNGILGMIEVVLTSKLRKHQHDQLLVAHHSAQSLLTIIDDILDFTKIEAGKLRMHVIDFDLVSLINDVVDSFAYSAQRKDLELLILNQANIPKLVQGDSGRIRQILNNLIGNAIKFTSTGEVLVSTSFNVVDTKHLEFTISVTDTGIGISPEKLDHLFDPFIQADLSTTRKFGGTGLGLSIAKQLCEAMNGNVVVKSKLHRGSEFIATLTLRSVQHLRPRPSLKQLLGEKSVLVIQNNPKALTTYKKAFQNQKIQCYTAQRQSDAILDLEHRTHDNLAFIIIDQHLPEMLDYSIISRLRNFITENTKILLMCDIAIFKDEIELKAQKIDGCITKPLKIEQLYQVFASTQKNTHPEDNKECDLNQELLSKSDIKDVEDCHLLLVEDNVTNQIVTLAMLAKLGFPVDVATNGKEALQILSESDTEYSLVLMDCHMPLMDGYEATRIIRSGVDKETNTAIPNPMIPIIAFTANVLKDDKEKCIAAGMNDVLVKPVDLKSLREKIHLWLNCTNF